ncbi:MAG: hypothetical protein ACD_15C00176G0001 [uncultured bacterium]|nr:MAG: hypothetical protein ACD_15C00176G0001 [uncultured bacterium]HCU71140.1 hypothetical protein [Candidatus Moranbacteria bacterium]
MENISFRKNILVIGSFALALYWAVFLWNFWSVFIDALGFNMTVFILGVLALFFLLIGIEAVKKNHSWVLPVALISLSFSLWENPFLKTVNILILPFVLTIFFAYSLSSKREMSIKFAIISIAERVILVTKIKEALGLVFRQTSTNKDSKLKLLSRIMLGSILFLVLALTIFIPLLSAADPAFAELMKGIVEWVNEIISFQYVNRIAFAFVAAFLIISYFLSFRRKTSTGDQDPPSDGRLFDPIVSGIVLGGVLALYLLFLATQLTHLWINQLPYDFSETVRLVKSGFWQLFVLSVINIIFFFGYFRKTNNAVQSILKIFIVASFLLLASAGHRMFLYAFNYGLSYEKFFASYTVIYLAVVFIWLAFQLFANRSGNISKFLIFFTLWMYAILTVMPVERIIFSTNVNLSFEFDSRIKLNELRMLSYDVLPLVTAHSKDEQWQKDWCSWAQSAIRSTERKKWYEKNLSNFATADLPEKWKTGACDSEADKSLNSNSDE